MSALIIHLCLLLTLTEGQRFVLGADGYQKPTRHEHYNPVLEPEPELALEPEPKPELRTGAVVVRCHADSMEVLVHADLYSTGLRVDGAHLRLGFQEHKSPEKCRAVATGASEYTLQSHLMDCGTVKHPSSEEIVYSNVLIYAPKPSSEGLLRLGGASIPIECRYNKFYSVNPLPLSPDWSPFISRTTAESKLDFNLKLMTGDWQFERGNHAYYVGDQIYLEASSVFGNHKPLHIFVDRCVATTTADENAALRYDFIDHGCLADAYLTNSSARFRLRTEKHKIQFQLDAFKFYQEKADQIYITCHLTAVPSLVNVKSRHRACSLIANRCGQSICSDYQVCCPHGNATCCKEVVDNTYYNIAMVTRKLSGVLIMLLLFAFGYFVQRMLCSRSRQLSASNSGPPTAATSQEMLIESYTPDSLRSPALSAPLPSYEDLKRLPTYEETIRESCIQPGTLT